MLYKGVRNSGMSRKKLIEYKALRIVDKVGKCFSVVKTIEKKR